MNVRAILLPALAILSACGIAQPPPPPLPGPQIVQPGGLAGSRWRVTAVNGRATPAAGDYVMRFEEVQLGARFGCNHMGGRYRVERGLLVVHDLAQTLIGCPEPSASFEATAGAVMREPMQMRWDGPDRLTLASRGGTIALARSP